VADFVNWYAGKRVDADNIAGEAILETSRNLGRLDKPYV
jgi:hypothetical protein